GLRQVGVEADRQLPSAREDHLMSLLVVVGPGRQGAAQAPVLTPLRQERQVLADNEARRVRGNRAEGTAHGVRRVRLGVEGVDVRHPAGGENKDDGPGFAATARGLAGKGPQRIQVAYTEPEQADGPGLNGGPAAEERVSRSVGTPAGDMPSECHGLAPRTRRGVQPSGSSILDAESNALSREETRAARP